MRIIEIYIGADMADGTTGINSRGSQPIAMLQCLYLDIYIYILLGCVQYISHLSQTSAWHEGSNGSPSSSAPGGDLLHTARLQAEHSLIIAWQLV